MTSAGAVSAVVDLVRRSGVLRHPFGALRILRRFGGTLPAAVELGALRFPERTALVGSGTALSFAQLRTAMRATAGGLAGSDGPVAVRTATDPETVVLLAGALAAGLDVVPLGPRLGDADAAEILARERIERVLDPVRDAVLDPALDPVSDPVLAPVSDDPVRDARPGARRRAVRGPGRLMLLSSGTTGAARATRRGRIGIAALVQLADLDRRIAWPTGPVLVLAPVDHGHGISAVIAGLLRGATVLLGAGAAPTELDRLTARHRPSSVTGVPLQLARALDAGALGGGGLRLIVSGSSRLDDALAERLVRATGARLIDCLGTTETGTFAVRHPPEPFAPLAGVRIRCGDDGLTVRTPMSGGPVGTGDRARAVPGGFVLHGRGDALADSAGELVSSERIARALEALDAVQECRVHREDDELRGSILIARVRAHGATGEELRAHLIAALGRAGAPRRVEVVDAF